MLGTIAFGVFGLAVLVSIAFLFSQNRKATDLRLILSGIALQVFFAVIVILVPGGREFFEFLSRIFVTVIGFSLATSMTSFIAWKETLATRDVGTLFDVENTATTLSGGGRWKAG